MKPKATETEISVLNFKVDATRVCIVGTTPLIYNAVSAKASHELLWPQGRKSTALKAASMKHDPIGEYRNSVYAYRDSDTDLPTRLYFPTGAFKKAIATAALDLPGVKKAQVGRLCWISEDKVAIYGTPQVLMSIVRSADMAHTPDVRTRAILKRWACSFTISSAAPILKSAEVGRLLASAGITVGIGDFRQEKGAGSYGQFRLCDKGDPEFMSITKTCGRQAQDDALLLPTSYDDETDKLWSWYYAKLATETRSVGMPTLSTKTLEEAVA